MAIIKQVPISGDRGRMLVDVLVDSGATESFVARRVAVGVASIQELPTPRAFTLADGSTYHVRNAAEIGMEVAGRIFRSRYLVQEGETILDVILGEDQLQAQGLTLDYARGVLCPLRQTPALKERLMATALGDFLRRTREEKNITADAVAQAGGIAISTYRAIEEGDIARPPDDRLRGFARALNVSFEQLRKLLPKEPLMINEILARIFARLGRPVSDALTDEDAINMLVDLCQPQPYAVASMPILTLLGLTKDATEAQVQGKIMVLQNRADVVPATELAALQAQLRTRDQRDAVAHALAEGKIYPAEKAIWEANLASGQITLGAFAAFVAERPKLMPIAEKLPHAPQEKIETAKQKPLDVMGIYADRRKARLA